MASGERQVAFVLAADKVRQSQTRSGMYYVIEVRNDVEQRADNAPQIDALAADRELALYQSVTLKDFLHQFAEDLTRQRHVALHPALKQLEQLGIAIALRIAIAANVFVDRVMNRSH